MPALGDKDKAFAWLDKAYEEHSFSLSNLKVEPRFDPCVPTRASLTCCVASAFRSSCS
jgi:hypothetical protein